MPPLVCLGIHHLDTGPLIDCEPMARVGPPYRPGLARAPIEFPPELLAAAKAAATNAGLNLNEWVRRELVRYLQSVAAPEEKSAA